MARDPDTLAHLEWLGYVQPVGLVVSIPALLAAQAAVNRNVAPDHARFIAMLPRNKYDEIIPEIRDLGPFTRTVLDWDESDLIDAAAIDDLAITLPEYRETLRPTFAVKDVGAKDAKKPWLFLVQCLPTATPLDDVPAVEGRHWQASPQSKIERLLRETEIPAGLLFNGTHLRLVYAPRGESSGYLTFAVAEMAKVAGRPIFAALVMLLGAKRLFTMAEKQRLPAILADSRKYQNVVSTKLAQQVLAALFELLRGFQAADDARKGELLRRVLAEDPNQVYAGLLTVLMRLVFVLYAEDRGLLSSDPVFANWYALTGLFDRLRTDAGRHPDTMDQRYGAWSQLLTLFRLVYEGGSHGPLVLPARKGYLFDPNRYPFLEGEPGTEFRAVSRPEVPRVSDGVVFRVLSNLLVLDGERLSYRTLDVEQIGSVYETIMGFGLEVAKGRSIAVKPAKAHGAPTTIDLDQLLAARSADRAKWLTERSDQKLTGPAAEALKNAKSVDDLLAGLEKKIAVNVTPNAVPKGAMVFQPSDERRRSGSHYTPRSLTEPIVRKTLEPVLKNLGDDPTPRQILDLKVCDPAMGSGAFLVEACRQLGDVLIKAWRRHDQMPRIPPDEDEILHARRLVAAHCLYGVDKNPMAVDLTKLSLWLATLAKDHPFTFLDHALRHGDSLVGLTKDQIAGFHWEKRPPADFVRLDLANRLEQVVKLRRELLDQDDETPYLLKQQKLAVADEQLNFVRRVGNLIVAAFFAADKPKARQTARDDYFERFSAYFENPEKLDLLKAVNKSEEGLLRDAKPIWPFHWEIEFPEVFGRENGGFDAMLGNPPFAGKNTLTLGNRDGYLEWLKVSHENSHGNADLVAHFFRRVFGLLKCEGAFGLIATKTIGQGDTRSTGLGWIRTHGGEIYAACKRIDWPGQAAVIVSIVHVFKGCFNGHRTLDDREVPTITAFLFYAGGDHDPETLNANKGLAFIGSQPYGMGFTFDDTDQSGIASTVAEMNALVASNPSNAQRIFPFIGYAEVADDAEHRPHRFIINFNEMTEIEARQWPDLMRLVEDKVKPARAHLTTNAVGRKRAEYWWQYGAPAKSLYEKIGAGLGRVLVAGSQASAHFAFAFLPSGYVYSSNLTVIARETNAAFGAIQSRIHEVWSLFFMTTLEDRLVYTPTTCFETFPFPESFETLADLEAAGKGYYEYRASLMVKNDEGLTKTYNRFHDPHEASPEIGKLRELHASMDRAVLDAYGWNDLQPSCEFLLEYEDEADDEDGESGRKRKKPWRYRWPDEFRDIVLARLLELNKERAETERLVGAGLQERTQKKSGMAAKKKQSADELPLYASAAVQLQIGRAVLCITVLLGAWRKTGVQRLRRDVLDAGLVLMLNDDLRKRLVGKNKAGKKRKKSAKNAFVPALESILDRLSKNEIVELFDVEGLPMIRLGPKAVPFDQIDSENQLRAEESVAVIEKEGKESVRSFLEENLHETYELVPG